jgi:hypothetical protein
VEGLFQRYWKCLSYMFPMRLSDAYNEGGKKEREERK